MKQPEAMFQNLDLVEVLVLGGEEEEENAGLGWAGSSSHKLLSSP